MHYEIFDFYNAPLSSEKTNIENNRLIWNFYHNVFNIDNNKLNTNLTLLPYAQVWLIIKKYLELNYSKEKINKILQYLNFDINIDNITDKDIDGVFIIQKITEYLYNQYNNEKYYRYIKSLQPNIS